MFSSRKEHRQLTRCGQRIVGSASTVWDVYDDGTGGLGGCLDVFDWEEDSATVYSGGGAADIDMQQAEREELKLVHWEGKELEHRFFEVRLHRKGSSSLVSNVSCCCIPC